MITRVAARRECFSNFGQIRNRIQALWKGADTVEIGAKTHVVDPRDTGDVIDVVDQRLEWRSRDLCRPFLLQAIMVAVLDCRIRVFQLGLQRIERGVALRRLGDEGLAVVLVNEGTITAPLFLATAFSISSVMFRG